MFGQSKPISTLLASHFKPSVILFTNTDKEHEFMTIIPYFSVVGILMYAMVCMWLSISQVVGVVRRYMNNLGRGH